MQLLLNNEFGNVNLEKTPPQNACVCDVPKYAFTSIYKQRMDKVKLISNCLSFCWQRPEVLTMEDKLMVLGCKYIFSWVHFFQNAYTIKDFT